MAKTSFNATTRQVQISMTMSQARVLVYALRHFAGDLDILADSKGREMARVMGFMAQDIEKARREGERVLDVTS